MFADIWLTAQINSFALHYSWLDVLGIFLASYLPFALIAAFIILGLRNIREILSLKASMPFRWLMLFEGFLAGFLGFFIAGVIGFLWARPRPFVLGDVRLVAAHAASPAFPSTHASIFFALSTVIFLYNRKAGLWFLLATAIMSIARVFCGFHWFSDVLAGMGLGILIGLVVYCFPRWLFHIPFSASKMPAKE